MHVRLRTLMWYTDDADRNELDLAPNALANILKYCLL